MKIYKNKTEDSYIKVEGNRYSSLGGSNAWFEIVHILKYYEETDLTEQEALLIMNL